MIIYEAKNIINEKRYIGQTQHTLEHRKRQHLATSKRDVSVSQHFYSAIRQYGDDNFQWRILDYATTQDELNEKESFWINFYNTTDPAFGYNLKGGGQYAFLTEDVKQKIGNAQKGSLNHMYGKYGKENPNSKKVLIVSTNEVFDSVMDLIRAYPEYKNGYSKICAVCNGYRKTYKGQKFRYLDEENKIIKNDNDVNIRFLVNYDTGEKFAKPSFAFHKYKKENQDKAWFYRILKKGYCIWNNILLYYEDVQLPQEVVQEYIKKQNK